MKYMSLTIPERIHTTRLKLKESQSVFGKRFGKSHAAVSEWESGKSEAPYQVIYLTEEILEDGITDKEILEEIRKTLDNLGFDDRKKVNNIVQILYRRI